MSKDNKTTFTVSDTEYAILKPNTQQNEDATMEYNRVFSKALLNGALLRERLDQFMREQNLWDDKKEGQYIGFLKQISEKEKALQSGGIKLSEARKTALEMRTIRSALQTLISEKNSLDTNTAQGQAENARFNSLLVSCLVYNDTGQIVYDDVDAYAAAEDEVSLAAAEHFANVYFGLDKNYENNLPENKFLVKYKFADGENRLINQKGELVDFEGRLINDAGRYIDGEGNLIDLEGNLVTEEGEYIVEFSPFLDDQGNPIKEELESKEEASAEAETEAKSEEDSGETSEDEVDDATEGSRQKSSKKSGRGRPKKKKTEEVS